MPAMIAEGETLRDHQELFELYVSDYVMLTRCKVRLDPSLQTVYQNET